MFHVEHLARIIKKELLYNFCFIFNKIMLANWYLYFYLLNFRCSTWNIYVFVSITYWIFSYFYFIKSNFLLFISYFIKNVPRGTFDSNQVLCIILHKQNCLLLGQSHKRAPLCQPMSLASSLKWPLWFLFFHFFFFFCL